MTTATRVPAFLVAAALLIVTITPVSAGGPDDVLSAVGHAADDVSRGTHGVHARESHPQRGVAETPAHQKDWVPSDDRVMLCHRAAVAPWVVLTVSASVPAHLDHDDVRRRSGGCAGQTDAVLDLGDRDRCQCGGWKQTIRDRETRQQSLGINSTSLTETLGASAADLFVRPTPSITLEPALVIRPTGSVPEALAVTEAASSSTGAADGAADVQMSRAHGLMDPLAVTPDHLPGPDVGEVRYAVERLVATPSGGSAAIVTEQVFPAGAGNMGFVDAAVGSLLSLSCLALAGVFGSRWLTARRR